jgi:hypothetical protein
LTIFNDTGTAVFTLDVSSNSTTLSTNTTPPVLGNGTRFSWQVQALVNGEVACTTASVSVVRDANAQNVGQGGGPAATPTACGWQGC